MFPMKFFEYLAAGLPVVSTNLPSLEESLIMLILPLAEEFASQISNILAHSSALDQLGVKKLVFNHSYRNRTERMIATINHLLS